MAFPVWRRNKKRVYVYYHDANTGKLRQLPRDQTAKLDGQPADAVHAWVEKWEREHGKSRDRAERIHLTEGDKLTALWRQYQTHRMATRKRRQKTADEETELLERYIIPFFVTKHQKKDPGVWHDLVPDFHAHMFDMGLADATIRKTLWLLERFGKHLMFQRYMTFPFVVQVPARQNNKVTPLKVRKSPEDILRYVRSTDFVYKDIDFPLAILLGYFAALRPSELFALEKADLLTGDTAADETKTYAGFKDAKLGSRLSVAVTKTLEDTEGAEPTELTKTDTSRAIVNIWHPAAAKLIAKLVKDKPAGRLFPYSYGWIERAWRTYVKPSLGATPHDLRRASCLYLGRTARLTLTLLQEHMRHAEIETTMLYTREPSVPEKRRTAKQDFDDVA